jgi:tRNA (guanine-N7-)-methyltransferase
VSDDFGQAQRRRYALSPRLPDEGKVAFEGLLPGPVTRWEIEIGPGRGGFLIERLQGRPEVGIIAFEVSRKWTTLVNDRLARLGLAPRGRVFCDDARLLALPRLEPPGKVACVYMHFPDPWWKKRHQKRLVMGTTFLDEAARLLAPGGELFVQTDVEERAETYETQIAAHPAFAPYGDAADAASRGSSRLAEHPYGARSHRERRAIDDAIPIYRLRFRRVG